MNNHLVFIYGTLRRGSERAMSIRFPSSKFIGDATVNGSLYDLGAFPGLLLNESQALVIGEIYEVDNATLSRLDDFEAASNYLRKQVEVSLRHRKMICWIYEANPEFYSPQQLIGSGDWIEYVRAKTN